MSDNKKRLTATRRVSDVERICEINHDRRKLAEENGEERIATLATPPRNDRNKRKVLRTACTACIMATGGGAAFAGMGIAMGHWQTVVLGLMIGFVFLLAGTELEGRIEHG